ncbi:hypothetical protein [Thiococcus pfennigii]|uniref:hypothetical protein n=1 Tax=Thiococcus pfennigii TaxID=1057 RepID=UPI0030B8D76A
MRTGELVFPWLMRRYFDHDLLDATALIWALKLTAFAILLQHVVPVDSWRVLAGAVNLHLFLLGVTLTLALLAPLLPGRPARSAATSTQPTEAPG